VAAVVLPVDREPVLGERRRQVVVAQHVLAHAVRQLHDAAHRSVRFPRPRDDLAAGEAEGPHVLSFTHRLSRPRKCATNRSCSAAG
jgi:hypothetical protein